MIQQTYVHSNVDVNIEKFTNTLQSTISRSEKINNVLWFKSQQTFTINNKSLTCHMTNKSFRRSRYFTTQTSRGITLFKNSFTSTWQNILTHSDTVCFFVFRKLDIIVTLFDFWPSLVGSDQTEETGWPGYLLARGCLAWGGCYLV